MLSSTTSSRARAKRCRVASSLAALLAAAGTPARPGPPVWRFAPAWSIEAGSARWLPPCACASRADDDDDDAGDVAGNSCPAADASTKRLQLRAAAPPLGEASRLPWPARAIVAAPRAARFRDANPVRLSSAAPLTESIE
jgi:hypothetical protein